MLDLERYSPVSALPPVKRDISIAAALDVGAEELGDRVRQALGEEADWLESVEVIGETPASELPPQALARIGMSTEQKNLLVRLVIRHPVKTLTDAEANLLRDRVYAAVHEGSVWQWAAQEA